MNVSNAKATLALNGVASPERAGSTGSISIGNTVKQSYDDADILYQTSYIMAGTTTGATLALTTGDATGDAWTAPVRQVETATAAGTVTGAGNAKATITASGLTGSPLDVTFAVTDEVAADWAELCRAALTANTDVAAMFDVSGTGTSIVLTRKPLATYTLGATSYEMAYSNDATLNIALDNDTSTGITTAATSANTTTAVVADGVVIANDDVDFEGFSLASPSAVYALLLEHSTGDENDQTLDYTIGTEYSGRLKATTDQSSTVLLNYPDDASILDTLSLTATSQTGVVTVTVVGKE